MTGQDRAIDLDDSDHDVAAVNDNAVAFADCEAPKRNELGETEQGVISAAVLVATAFRLRDEPALIQTLRRLAIAVRRLEDDDTA